MNSLSNFLTAHNLEAPFDDQRMGQRFVNLYIKNPWPELFHETCDEKCVVMISQWLIDHQYTEKLPKKCTHPPCKPH